MSYFMYQKAATSLQQWTNNHNTLFNIIIINSFKVESTSIIHNVVVFVCVLLLPRLLLMLVESLGCQNDEEDVDDHAISLISNLRTKSINNTATQYIEKCQSKPYLRSQQKISQTNFRPIPITFSQIFIIKDRIR